MTLLSILIPTTPEREPLLKSLTKQFDSQLGESTFAAILHDAKNLIWKEMYKDVEVIYYEDYKLWSIGYKRGELLKHAAGKYIAFVDDDDQIRDNYFSLVLEGCRKDVDCCSLKGIIYEKNSPPRYFEHSLRYDKYETVEPDPEGFADRKYLRFPNHLNAVRASIAKQFSFPGENHGEDTMWATRLHESGLLKTEHYISEVLYYYTPSDTRK